MAKFNCIKDKQFRSVTVEIAEKILAANLNGKDGELEKLAHTMDVFECPKDFLDSGLLWQQLLSTLRTLIYSATQIKQHVEETTYLQEFIRSSRR